MTLTSYSSFCVTSRGRAHPTLYLTTALSKYAQNALAIRICSGVRQFGSNMCGVPTRMHTHRAREVATFRRWRLKRNSMPWGASSWLKPYGSVVEVED